MCRQITRTQINGSYFLMLLWVMCFVLAQSIDAKAQRVNRSRTAAADETYKMKIAVLPFRNAFSRRPSQAELASILGDGIADSLTNSLKSVSGLDVINTERVLQVAARFPNSEINASDEDALRIANSLSVQIVVVGSFQLANDHLHVDGRILLVQELSQLRAQPITADAVFPNEYSTLLTKLFNSIVTYLKRPVNQLKQNDQSALTGTMSAEGYRLYLLGRKAARDKTVGALNKAIEFFDKALGLEPDNPNVLVAKAQAQLDLYNLKKGQENADNGLVESARGNAVRAVNAAPQLGSGYQVLSQAQEALGDRESSRRSRGDARRLWPGDGENAQDLAWPADSGKLVRSAETDRMFLQHPDFGFRFPQLPKILVKNDSQYRMTIRVIPDQGPAYPPVIVGGGQSRLIPIFPGHCRLKVETEVGALEDEADFREGQDYDFQYSTQSFPIGEFTFVNHGEYTLRVRVSGHPSMSLTLGPDETKTITMPAGVYSITARVLSAMKTDTYELSAGAEEKLIYSYSGGRVPVFDPAELTISNDGNAPFTATISGSRRYRMSVPPGGKTITIQAGDYTIVLACGGDVTEAGEFQLLANSETTVPGYSCQRRYRYVIR